MIKTRKSGLLKPQMTVQSMSPTFLFFVDYILQCILINIPTMTHLSQASSHFHCTKFYDVIFFHFIPKPPSNGQ